MAARGGLLELLRAGCTTLVGARSARHCGALARAEATGGGAQAVKWRVALGWEHVGVAVAVVVAAAADMLLWWLVVVLVGFLGTGLLQLLLLLLLLLFLLLSLLSSSSASLHCEGNCSYHAGGWRSTHKARERWRAGILPTRGKEDVQSASPQVMAGHTVCLQVALVSRKLHGSLLRRCG